MKLFSYLISTACAGGSSDVEPLRHLMIFTLTGLFLFSCAPGQKVVDERAQTYNTDFRFEKDQVLILLVDLQRESASLRKARLIEGDFRPIAEEPRQKESVRVQYLDASDQVLYEKILDNPLVQYKEYSDEAGKLKYVRVEEEKGSLLLRSQYSKSFRSIRIDYGHDKSFRKISQLTLLVDD